MSDIRDDSTPPGHGFAYSEPFPLNAGDRIAALETKNDQLAAEVLAERTKRREAEDLLGAAADLLASHGPGHVLSRIQQHLGRVEGREWRVPRVGGVDA